MTDTSTPGERHVALFMQKGSSDKEYHIHLVPRDGGWVVDFQYGRRGKALRAGTKTAAPVDFGTAAACYDKVLKGQLKDGYTPTEGGGAFQDTHLEKRFTGVVPQLLNPIDEAGAEAWITSPQAFAQEKFDGERRLIQVGEGTVTGINRSGLAVALPKTVEQACLAIQCEGWIGDGEDMGGHVVLFDLLEVDGEDLRGQPAAQRLRRLEALVQDSDILQVAKTFHDEPGKRALIEDVRERAGEGVVFKRNDAPYKPGRPASGGDHVKLKFVESATVRVCAGRATRRSVGIEAMDEAGQWNGIGNVTIPPNHDIPAAGALIEVRYLYAYPGGSLAQPVLARARPDLGEDACVLSQLKYKPQEAPARPRKAMAG